MTSLREFAIQKQQPSSTAIMDRGKATSYRDLSSRAEALAVVLRRHGAGPGTVVPIQSVPDVEPIVQILAILRTGAAYATIDARVPNSTAARIARMCGSPYVLSSSSARFAGVMWLTSGELLAASDLFDSFTPVVPESTAYLVFTSGTTGDPKGVVVPDEAVDAYLDWSMEEYEVTSGYGAPLFTSFGFDLTVTSLLGPLVAGRRAEVYDAFRWPLQIATDPRRLDGASFMKVTPSQMDLLCNLLQEQKERCSLRRLVVGGEAMYGQSVSRWRKSFPDTVIVNEYGPSEATVGCCRYAVPVDYQGDEVPIGTPPRGVQLTLATGPEIAFPDTEGELVIAGKQVATGYLTLNADTVDDGPGSLTRFQVAGGARVYASGDRVHRSADGVFTYRGRLGREVKVSGFRVNLAAIESRLVAYPGVVNASVRQLSDTELQAVVIARNDRVDERGILRHLRKTFPAYAMPTDIRIKPQLETTERGKVKVEYD